MTSWRYGVAMAAVLATGASTIAAPPVLRPVPTRPAPRPAPVSPGGPLRPIPRQALTAAGATVLKCRGGPVKLIGLQLVPAGYAVFAAHFSKGTKPAEQGLEPTQCAWPDRAMSADESSVVCQEINDLLLSLAHGHDASFAPPDFWILDNLHSNTAKWIDKLRSPDEYFEFQVKSEGCQRVVT